MMNENPNIPEERTLLAEERTKVAVLEGTLDPSTGVGKSNSVLIPAASSVYAIRGNLYTVVQTLSANSGEADIYLVELDGKNYALKIYHANARPKSEVFTIVANMRFELIVKVEDFGTITLNGQSHFYELMEFLEGGVLSDYKINGDERAFARIALSAAAALAYCHANMLIHKDIKPGNFFFRDKERTQLVLGDFGISTIFEDGDVAHRTTQARTPVYAAPEMYVDVIDGEVEITPGADYYSLGITLMYVWLGRNPFTKNERVMMRMKNEGRLPEVDKMPPRVRQIIRGLTGPNPERRWTYDEVERWYKGEEVPIDESSYYLHYKAFVVDPDRNVVAHDVKELAPLLNDNRDIGIRYLYGKRISRWLEDCGNTKLALVLDDIVERRYPKDLESGLTAAIYAMDENFPYYGVNGEVCHSIQDVSMVVLRYADLYGERLKNPSDLLYLYLAAHKKIDRDRLSHYFCTLPKELAIARFIYEVDDTVPFLNGIASSTAEEIAAAFGAGLCSEDQWHSLVDGRLLSWMSSRYDVVKQEAVRALTEGKPYSQGLAYAVLYTIDRKCAFDLQDAFTPQDVAVLFDKQLQATQDIDNVAFANHLNDFVGLNGRLHFYAIIHGWKDVLRMQDSIMNLTSRENTERLGVYDVRTAGYKFCAALGVIPSYSFEVEGRTVLARSKEDVEMLDTRLVRQEMRLGSLKSWAAIFFHENPKAQFIEELSYEKMLRDYLAFVGKYDPADHFYKRFVSAREGTKRAVENTTRTWDKAVKVEKMLRTAIMAPAGLLVACLLLFGIPKADVFMHHIWFAVWLPLCFGSMIVGGVKGYFSANGVTVVLIGCLAGMLSSLVPIYALKALYGMAPSLLAVGCAAVVLVYVGICLTWGRQASLRRLDDLNSLVSRQEDVNSQLVEPLFYAFKSRTLKYKPSKSNLMDDIVIEITTAEGELSAHYSSWIILFGLFVIILLLYHPMLLNRPLPDFAEWTKTLNEWMGQAKDVR